MSAETATLAAVLSVQEQLVRIERRLDMFAAAARPDLLTTAQAARYAGVSRSTLNEWLRRGLLSDVPSPTSRRRWRRDELDQCLAGGRRR